MELTYIFHSGFVVQTQKCVLIFDYWMDPAHVVESVLSQAQDKRVYVLSSHFHEDHFVRSIFEWRKLYPQLNITYILSKDILRHRRASADDADVWLAKGGCWADDYVKVRATGSNDSGVSWVIDVTDSDDSQNLCHKRLFHAGDLCNWYARFLAEEPVPETIVSPEFGTIHPKADEKMFLGELKDIRKLTDYFDLVMFPVDGRIGNGYTLGARQFIERFKVGLFVPMHFVASGFESAWRMEPFCQEKLIPFWSICEEGETIGIGANYYIRRSRLSDMDRLQEIFAHARQIMQASGNRNQWADNYPSLELLEKDIASGDSYVMVQGDRVVATFVLRGGIDATYNEIWGGNWLNDEPYGTIHRIATNGEMKGIFRKAMAFAQKRYKNIRIDTHRDNTIMQHQIQKAGFVYCGIIHCWNGDERLAYQFDPSQAKQ